MNKFLVFNGDADGICSAHLYYLDKKTDFKSITGVKRDISLLKRIENVEKSEINVFDIAVEKNLEWLNILLTQDNRFIWFDHHISKEQIVHPNIVYNIQTDPDINTSFIVSQYVNEPLSRWAIVGLFGDNMQNRAYKAAKSIGLNEDQVDSLKKMGELINYNAYGSSVEDLHFHPAKILTILQPYAEPFEFLRCETILDDLEQAYKDDLAKTDHAEWLTPNIVRLPDKKWAHRIVGEFAYKLVKDNPEKDFAVLLTRGESLQVSVRTASGSNRNAGEFCLRFPTGGGRAKAAGINVLEANQLDEFIKEFNSCFLFEN